VFPVSKQVKILRSNYIDSIISYLKVLYVMYVIFLSIFRSFRILIIMELKETGRYYWDLKKELGGNFVLLFVLMMFCCMLSELMPWHVVRLSTFPFK